MPVGEPQQILKHDHLPMADGAGPAADHRDVRLLHNPFGNLVRRGLDEQHDRAGLLHGHGVADHPRRLLGRAAE